MTLEQFKYLSPKEQEFALKTQAVFIASMHDKENIYNLFQIDSFYLEVYYNVEENVVSSLIYFDEINMLEPYLKLIDIKPIYQLLE